MSSARVGGSGGIARPALTPYEYSTIKEIHQGNGPEKDRTHYRGKCVCGRRTHLTYSTPAAARTAIAHVHNRDTETERHHHQ